MLELKRNSLSFSFPEVHTDAKVDINFQRTLRIPDDAKNYPLPPGLGSFPVRLVDDFKDRVPAKWTEHGGVMLPLFQSEALWLQFSAHSNYRRSASGYPFALKVGTGKVSAVTGELWSDGLTAKDYLVVPPQPWLDGYVVEDGVVRQFVAAPLGWGFSAEEQITGKAEHGGIQLEVIPMKAEVYNRRFPEREVKTMGVVTRSCSVQSFGEAVYSACYETASLNFDMERSVEVQSMSLAPGGRMTQQIHEDPYDMSDWDFDNKTRVFVHLANSMVWKAITKHDPPHPPPTAAEYTAHGLPWFEHYTDNAKTLKGTDKLASMKSVMAMGFQKGLGILPENKPAEIKPEKVAQLADKPKNPNEVREGRW